MKKLFILFSLFAIPLSAEENLQISGFGTIGNVWVDSDYYGYRKDIAQEDGTFDGDFDLTSTSILGIQFDYVLNNEFDLVYQAVYRDQNELNFDTATNLAFVKYSPSAAWSYRIGRTALDLFLLTEFRDVGFAYTWAHTPSEVYGLVPYRFLDGIDASYSTRLGDIGFRTKIFTGASESDIGRYKSQETVSLDNIYGLTFEFDSFDWSIKAKYTSIKIDEPIPSATNLVSGLNQMSQAVPGFDFIWPDAASFAQSLELENTRADYASIGGQYNFDQWSFIGELSFIRSSDTPIIPNVNSGYASAIYNTNNHSIFAVYAFTDSDNFDLDSIGINLNALSMIPGGIELYYGTESTLNFFASNQSTISIGWRWNINDTTALKVQWDTTDIDLEGGTLWLNKNPAINPAETVSTIFTNVSFTF